MKKKLHQRHSDTFEREEYLNRVSFGHEIPEKIEIEPFSHPSVALQNTRILETINKKEKSLVKPVNEIKGHRKQRKSKKR